MRIMFLAFALLAASTATASEVRHPTNEPPGIVANDEAWFLDSNGHAWYAFPESWNRVPEADPPVPWQGLRYWGSYWCLTFDNECWVRSQGVWTSMGIWPEFPSSGVDAGSPAQELRTTPNPSTDATRISFSLASPGHVSVRLFDATGRQVRVLLDGDLPAGETSLTWDGRSDAGEQLPTGVYFSRVEAASGASSGRIVVR